MAQQKQEQIPSSSIRKVETELGASAGSPVIGTDAEQTTAVRVSSPGRDAWRRLQANTPAMISLAILLLLILMAVFAPFMHTQNFQAQDYVNAGTHQAPNGAHWMGTDANARDLYSRLIYGLRVPLFVALFGTFVTLIIGLLIGVVAGYLGGWIDSVLSRFTDLVFALPPFLLIIMLVGFFGNWFDLHFGALGKIIALTGVFAIVGWPFLMRFIRSLVLSLKEQQFVEAARTSGSSHWKIMIRHLLPNMWGLIMVQAAFVVVSFIYIESTLAIFGLGVDSNAMPDLGVMINDGREFMDLNFWEVLFPSVVLTVLILAGTFLGDGLRDAIDPRSKA